MSALNKEFDAELALSLLFTNLGADDHLTQDGIDKR
jgi:hypothetical protein